MLVALKSAWVSWGSPSQASSSIAVLPNEGEELLGQCAAELGASAFIDQALLHEAEQGGSVEVDRVWHVKYRGEEAGAREAEGVDRGECPADGSTAGCIRIVSGVIKAGASDPLQHGIGYAVDGIVGRDVQEASGGNVCVDQAIECGFAEGDVTASLRRAALKQAEEHGAG